MIPIPTFLLSPKLLMAAGLTVALFGSGWLARGHFANASIAKLEAAHSRAVASAEKKARDAVEQARAREHELTEKTKEIVDEARNTIETLERSIRASDAASSSMFDAARRAASRCPASANPATSGGGSGTFVSSSMSDGDRFLRVLGELDGAAGAYAADSGRARASRDACQRSYEAAMKAVNK